MPHRANGRRWFEHRSIPDSGLVAPQRSRAARSSRRTVRSSRVTARGSGPAALGNRTVNKLLRSTSDGPPLLAAAPPPRPARIPVDRRRLFSESTAAAVERWGPLIDRIAEEEDFPAHIVRGIIAAESGGKEKSGAGKRGYKGLMQAGKGAEHLDAEFSIRSGIRKFKKFRVSAARTLARYGVDNFDSLPIDEQIQFIMVAYNAGPGTLARAMAYAATGGDFKRWNEPQFFQRALFYYGAYSTSVGVSRIMSGEGPAAVAGHLAAFEGASVDDIRSRFTSGNGAWRRKGLAAALVGHLERQRATTKKQDLGYEEFRQRYPLLAWSAEVKHNNLRSWYVAKVIRYASHFAGEAPQTASTAESAPAPGTTPPAPTATSDTGPEAASGGGGSLLDAILSTAGRVAGSLVAAGALLAALGAGSRDRNELTNLAFWACHPEMQGQKLSKDHPDFAALSSHWLQLRNNLVDPLLAQQVTSGPATPTPISTPTGGGSAGGRGMGEWKRDVEPRRDDATRDNAARADEYEGVQSNVQSLFERQGKKYGADGSLHYIWMSKLFDKRGDKSFTGGNFAVWLNELTWGDRFCGFRLNGIHPKLADKLHSVEPECEPLVRQIADAGVPMKFEASFQPRPVTGNASSLSNHALGLAIHLNYAQNPFVGRNKQVKAIIDRIYQQAHGDTFWDNVKPSGRVHDDAEIERLYDMYASGSDAIASYFGAIEAMEAEKRAGTLDAVGLADLTRRKSERATLRRHDFGRNRKPEEGMFAHTRDLDGDPMLALIKQLTGPANLVWGGTYRTGRDLHHFDLRG